MTQNLPAFFTPSGRVGGGRNPLTATNGALAFTLRLKTAFLFVGSHFEATLSAGPGTAPDAYRTQACEPDTTHPGSEAVAVAFRPMYPAGTTSSATVLPVLSSYVFAATAKTGRTPVKLVGVSAA